LLGADRERCAFGGEALKRGDGAREGPALPCDIRFVIFEKLREHLIDIVAGAKPAQGLLNHDAYPEAHRRTDGCCRDRRVAAASKRVIQRCESDAVSTSVPSRSKTMVAPFSIGLLSHAPCERASGGVCSGG
jgi:hypothetical protein